MVSLSHWSKVLQKGSTRTLCRDFYWTNILVKRKLLGWVFSKAATWLSTGLHSLPCQHFWFMRFLTYWFDPVAWFLDFRFPCLPSCQIYLPVSLLQRFWPRSARRIADLNCLANLSASVSFFWVLTHRWFRVLKIIMYNIHKTVVKFSFISGLAGFLN